MSITVRLWSKAELESLQHNRFLATMFMNGSSFSKEEMRYYPYNLRRSYVAQWGSEEPIRVFATDDTMLLRFLDAEYKTRPDDLAEEIKRYRVIIG